MARDLSRPATARVLFEIQDIVSRNNLTSGSAHAAKFLSIAVRIGSRADGMLKIAKSVIESYAPLLEDPTFPGRIQMWLMSAAARRDIAMLRLLVDTVSHFCGQPDFTNDTIFTDWKSNMVFLMLIGVIRQLYAWDPEQYDTIVNYIQLLVQSGILSHNVAAATAARS
ncbi:hypothetical protein Daus18300_000377 [Diaporthe australafricana]|uniref:Uncharacterized protein n=1 Tax=Diaporthe australafricana TaxID=127596 RepID=A0ABR3Y5M7_9PEZI